MRAPERHISAILDAAAGFEDLLLNDISSFPGSAADAEAIAEWRARVADAHGRADAICAHLRELDVVRELIAQCMERASVPYEAKWQYLCGMCWRRLEQDGKWQRKGRA